MDITQGCGLVALLAPLLAACAAAPPPDGSNRSAAGGASEWQDLSNLSSWRGYRRQDLPASWRNEGGVIAFIPASETGQRGDIVTREQFGDFELQYQWRISEGGNSGVMYRATEEEQTPWRTGPEMQILDDARHADGRIPSHRSGALYDLLVPPENITRPVGEWNEARVVVRGNHIQQWLNGHVTADIVVGSPQWNEVYGRSKFAQMATFASRDRGHIVLQDHGDPVWFRGVRVRRLDGAG
ncbi:MAG: DUF1080 domain-containing protein [Gemmatimonadetes bacterium]|nr:DUF1080 domain-containing protein [Gemmatimonadota bacterium]